jgi:hypothetical protein
VGVKLQFCSVVLRKIDKCGYRYEFDIDCFKRWGIMLKLFLVDWMVMCVCGVEKGFNFPEYLDNLEFPNH